MRSNDLNTMAGVLLLALLALGCGEESDAGSEGPSGGDSDADTDADSDADGDYFLGLPQAGTVSVGIDPPAGLDDGPWNVSIDGGPPQPGEPVTVSVTTGVTVVVDFVLQLPTVPGDLDGDSDVDRDDLNVILAARNTPASGPDDPRDLDGDGMITVLDARKLVLLCTRPRCACE